MKIEEAIKQKTFASEYLKAHINLIYTAAWANLRIAHTLRPFDITLQQFNILRILRGRSPEPASIKELMERMLDKSSNASRLVDKLLLKELVIKKVAEEDSRRMEVGITQKGLQLINQASVEVEKEIATIFSSLSTEDAAALNSLLDKIRN